MVVARLDAVDVPQLAAVVAHFDHASDGPGIEARVHGGEDKRAAGPEQPAQRGQQRLDGRHVHDRHVADGGIEALVAQRGQCVRVGGVERAELDVGRRLWRARPGDLDHLRADVGRQHVRHLRRDAAGKVAVGAGDFEHAPARLRREQALGCRVDQRARKAVALFADVVVPESGVVIPDRAHFVAQFRPFHRRFSPSADKWRDYSMPRQAVRVTQRQQKAPTCRAFLGSITYGVTPQF